jgi:hypothetical protein
MENPIGGENCGRKFLADSSKPSVEDLWTKQMSFHKNDLKPSSFRTCLIPQQKAISNNINSIKDIKDSL